MHVLLTVSSIFYLTSGIGYILYLFAQKDAVQRAAWWLFLAGLVLHGTAVTVLWTAAGQMPVRNLKETLIISSLALSLAYLVFYYRFRLRVLGAVVVPLAAFIVMAAALIPCETAESHGMLNSFWLVLHIVTIFAGEAALALACGLGILYLVQEGAIKNKRHGFFFRRLPSLELLDSAGYACIVTGFTLVTIGLATGFVYAKMIWGRFWTWDPKEVWSGITWLIYAVLLHERLTVGWRGRKSAIMAIAGFALLLFTFFGVNFLLEGHHEPFTRGGTPG